MKNKIILKKKTLQEMEMKRMPKKAKKSYKRWLEVGEIFNHIIENEDTEEIFERADCTTVALFGLIAKTYRDNL